MDAGEDMTVKFLVYVPGKTSPIDLDDYANIIASIAGHGTSEQSPMLPDVFVYDNPKTSTRCSVGELSMRSN